MTNTAEEVAVRQLFVGRQGNHHHGLRRRFRSNSFINQQHDRFSPGLNTYPEKFKKIIQYYWQKGVISPAFLLLTLILFILLPDDLMKERLSVSLRRALRVFIKRTFDIFIGSLGLLLCSAFFIIIAILIKLDSPGPILYRQLRIGRNRRRGGDWGSRLIYQASSHNFDRRLINFHGQPFYLYKFRTMRHNAELMTGPVWATKKDPRITRIGKLLRMTHLDELPQFINVLKGEMSIVGPRPERPCFVTEFAILIPDYAKRFEVKPGITGAAQIYNGYDTCLSDVKKKLKYEIDYMNRNSVWLDLKLIFLTAITIFKQQDNN